MEKKIGKIFNEIYRGKELELIGVSSNTLSKFNSEDIAKSRKKVVYTIALKQKKLLIPVMIENHYTDDDIRLEIEKQLALFNVEL